MSAQRTTWRVVEKETRLAVCEGKRTIAYVQIGRNDSKHAALIAAAPELLQLAEQYAKECGECAGTGIVPALKEDGSFGPNVPCEECRFIRVVLAKVRRP